MQDYQIVQEILIKRKDGKKKINIQLFLTILIIPIKYFINTF